MRRSYSTNRVRRVTNWSKYLTDSNWSNQKNYAICHRNLSNKLNLELSIHITSLKITLKVTNKGATPPTYSQRVYEEK